MKVVFVVGQTASGKSQLALDLAEKFGGVILNMDSIQCYEGLDVGSAKPTAEEMRKVPHFLFSYVRAPKVLTAGQFRRDFLACLEDLKDKVSVAFAVGGTGFYLKAIENGIFESGPSDPRIREDLMQRLEISDGAESMWQELRENDPVAAARISVNDHYRLVRALEIIQGLHKTPTELNLQLRDQRDVFPYQKLKIGIAIEKPALAERIRARTQVMLAKGLVDEVRGLLDQGLVDWRPLASVGYQQCVQFLKDGNWTIKELEDEIVLRTLQLAKKQKTWFQRDTEIRWNSFDVVGPFLKEPEK